MSEYSTVGQIVDAVITQAKAKQWLSCTYRVRDERAAQGYYSVGIKSYGLWVQRVEVGGLRDGLPEQKTERAMRAALITLIHTMLDQQ